MLWTKKVDKMHKTGEDGKTICGNPMLGNNYAKEYPIREQCHICFADTNAKRFYIFYPSYDAQPGISFGYMTEAEMFLTVEEAQGDVNLGGIDNSFELEPTQENIDALLEITYELLKLKKKQEKMLEEL